MKLELYKHFQAGFAKKQQLRTSEGGDWRGGNSGCMTEDGTIIGYNPRHTVLRHLGVEKRVTLDDDLIFDAGFRNEDHLTELLGLAGVRYKCEEDIPVAWALPNGQTITGRPDIVVGLDGDSWVPHYGIEVKLISSNGKMMAHSHFGEANPNAKHVCQGAHYSSKFGIDWVLAYISRAHYTSFYWRPDRFQFEHRSMLVDESNGKVIKVGPFMSLYDLTWDGDKLLIDDKPTIITASGIERYYQYCSDCVKNEVIPERGGEVDIFGKKVDKNENVLYDDFNGATEVSFEAWVADCREIAEAL